MNCSFFINYITRNKSSADIAPRLESYSLKFASSDIDYKLITTKYRVYDRSSSDFADCLIHIDHLKKIKHRKKYEKCILLHITVRVYKLIQVYSKQFLFDSGKSFHVRFVSIHLGKLFHFKQVPIECQVRYL